MNKQVAQLIIDRYISLIVLREEIASLIMDEKILEEALTQMWEDFKN